MGFRGNFYDVHSSVLNFGCNGCGTPFDFKQSFRDDITKPGYTWTAGTVQKRRHLKTSLS